MGIHDRPYYRDDEPPGLRPSWNNKSPIATIIIICVAVFLLDMLLGGRSGIVGRTLALHSENLVKPWMWWQTLTYGFVHDRSGIGHIFWNMLGLWMLGRGVEERYGWAEFWRIYLVSVVLCGVSWLLIQQTSSGPATLAGASGAVCCIQMLYVLNFPRATLMIWGILPVQAWIIGTMLIASNILVTPNTGGPRIAYEVHLAGIAFAFIYFYGNLNLGFVDGLGRMLRTTKRKLTGPKLKAYQPDRDQSDAVEADRLLDKIHKSGQDSLTRKERKFLEQYSQRVRERQKSH